MASYNNLSKYLSQNDIDFLKSGTYDEKHYNPSTKNNVLHILAFTNNLFKNFEGEIRASIEKDPEFINRLNAKNRTPLIEAITRGNYNYANFLLTFPNINVNVRDINNYSAFSMACQREQKDLIIDLLLKGARYISGDLEEIKNKDLKNAISDALFLPVSKNDQISDSLSPDFENELNFKIFYQDDLIVDENSKVGAGSYGTTFPATIKETGEVCIVKKFKYESEDFLESSQIRDIVYLNMLQPLNTTVKIYGIFIDPNNSVYIVLESLKYNLRSFFEILFTRSETEKKDACREILKMMLQCNQANSNAGLIHCDSKDDNMMFDSNGVLKYIDYGFSYFLGIIPFETNVNHQIHEGSYVLKDGFVPEREIEVYDDDVKIFTYMGSNVGLNFDIPTLANCFLVTVNSKFNKYRTIFTHDSKYYILLKKEEVKTDGKVTGGIIRVKHDQSIESDLINYYGTEFTELLTEMLEIDQKIRKSSTELLSYPFFGEERITVPKDLPFIKVEHVSVDLFSKVASLNFTYNQSSVNTILPHVDSIIKYYSKQFLKSNKFCSNDNYLENIDYILRVHLHLNSSFDVIYNAIMLFNQIASDKINELNNRIKNPETMLSAMGNKFRFEYLAFEKPILLVICYFHYLPIFDDIEKSIEQIFDYCFGNMISKYKIIEEMKYSLNLVRRYTKSYIITPVLIYINYIQYILQTVCLDMDYIQKTIIKLISRVLKVIVYSDIEVNIFELVKAVYYASSQALDIHLEHDANLVERVKKIIQMKVKYPLV